MMPGRWYGSRLLLISGLLLVGTPVLVACSSSQHRAATPAPLVDRRAEVDALIRRGDAAAAKGDSAKAAELYGQALAIDSERFVAWNNLGVELMKQQNYMDAVSAFKVAADLSPRDPRPLSNIGLAYQEMGWANEALANYEAALQRDSTFLDALRGAAVAEDTLGYASQESLARVRQALMIEQDQEWRSFFERRRFRIESQLRSPTSVG